MWQAVADGREKIIILMGSDGNSSCATWLNPPYSCFCFTRLQLSTVVGQLVREEQLTAMVTDRQCCMFYPLFLFFSGCQPRVGMQLHRETAHQTKSCNTVPVYV